VFVDAVPVVHEHSQSLLSPTLQIPWPQNMDHESFTIRGVPPRRGTARRHDEQYGDIVGMAPDELSFATKDAWQEIYVHRQGHNNFTKSETWYKGS